MKRYILAALVAVCTTLAADPAKKTTPSATAKEIPGVEAAIPPVVKALGVPMMMNFPGGIKMAVSSTSEKAQAHVNQGLNHLHGGWEFEASRHFAAAMREDPECLLAHWGMVMSLLNPSPETGDARNAATDRLLYLVEKGQGTDLERGYAYGLIKYIQEGPIGASVAFRKVADRFPNELQAGVFAALFRRGGYDEAGDPTPDQEAAEKSLLDLIQKHPKSPIPLNALLVIRAEAPDLSSSIEMAKTLCQMTPDYAPSFHLLGHYNWRCGHHGEAASAFGRASSFYQKWMKENKATLADCPEWVKAECYRIIALASKGDFDTAFAAARQVASTPLPANRPASAGTRMLLWEAKTLPARLLISHGLSGNAEQAAQSLPKPNDLEKFRKYSLAYWWLDGLRFTLEAHRLIDAGKLDEARDVVAALTQHGEAMTLTQKAATESGERSQWTCAFRALEVLASDVRGRLAMAGPIEKQNTAYNWYASAADRQHPAPMMLPPSVLTPMASRLGAYFLSAKKYDDAISSYLRALVTCPNDMDSLVGLNKSYEAAGKTSKAQETAKQIESLKSE